MHGDRIIGYVSQGFIDTLNKFIFEKTEDFFKRVYEISGNINNNHIELAVNIDLKEKLKALELENQTIRKCLFNYNNSLRSVQATLKKFDKEIDEIKQ